MYIASMDNKTAFDVSKPRHIAKIMDGQDSWVYCGRLYFGDDQCGR